VETDTFAYMIWTFSILAVSASYFIKFNHRAYIAIDKILQRFFPKKEDDKGGDDHHGHNRDIILLGFGRVANELVSEIHSRCPALLTRCFVIDPDVRLGEKLKRKGVGFAYGDIGNEELLEHCLTHCSSHIKLVMITEPDSRLGNTRTNLDVIIKVKALECCSGARMVAAAEKKADEQMLYDGGADYVLKIVKLGAERLCDMLEQYAHGLGHGNQFDGEYVARDFALDDVLKKEAQADRAKNRRVSYINQDPALSKKALNQAAT
jgi:hypothetical protein